MPTQEPQEELLEIADRLDALTGQAQQPAIHDPLVALRRASEQIGKAWSGSALGYHANVYYDGLKAPPPGAQFSPEWGLQGAFGMGSHGDWLEFDPDEVERAIHDLTGNLDLSAADAFDRDARKIFDSAKADILSVLQSEIAKAGDSFLDSVKSQVQALSLLSRGEITDRLTPRGANWSRDSLAVTQGLRAPPHLQVLAKARAIQYAAEVVEKLAQQARQAGSHLVRRQRQRRNADVVGTNVFIGHGRSLLWRELKDFVENRLKLPADEFNRVPVAGITNISRLSEMLDAAAIAFLIMTGEDEQADGKLHARMNVVHESGLFQGRLGFTRAVVLLEEGCEAFSNIEGLGHIRFPKGNIKAAFEEIREVCEREGLLGASETARCP